MRSMRDRVMECRNEPQTVRDLIPQWMVTHRCTHRDVGIVCQAILSPPVWREAKREAEWPAEEGAEWDVEARQAARDRLYDAIQRALKPPTLDWNRVFAIQQKPGERAEEFKHRLIQGFLAHGGIPTEGEIPQRLLTNFLMEGLRLHLKKQLKYVMLGWQAQAPDAICTAADQCAVRHEEKAEKEVKVKEEVVQMVLREKVRESRDPPSRPRRPAISDEEESDSEEDESQRQSFQERERPPSRSRKRSDWRPQKKSQNKRR